MENLGKVFREFRTSGNYSLKEAAVESCSTSQLSRFTIQTILQVFKSFKENNLKRLEIRQIPSILS